MDLNNTVPQSDEEEDLEALRLAALQSLKKNAAPSQAPTSRGYSIHHRYGHGRSGFNSSRGGQHSNLIPLIKPESSTVRTGEQVFRLPQDKYEVKSEPEVKKSDSKFDRYNDTDKSDEEDSEDELLRLNSDEEDDEVGGSPRKLEKSNSLEALMQELDDEIRGNSKLKVENPKIKKVESETVRAEDTTVQEATSSSVKNEEVEVSSSEEAVVKITPEDNSQQVPDHVNVPKRPRSPFRRGRFFNSKRGKRNNLSRQVPMPLPVAPFLVNPNPIAFMPNVPPPPIFTNNHLHFMHMNTVPTIAPFYSRPLSPLQINTETLQTQTRAPLSPRSAAFVLQNRAIIEKRKRSPRRSYSRSPSPRGRSLSPRRSRSPTIIRKRSMSPPVRKRSPSPLRKRSRSPLRKRSLSPKRRNFSPKRRSPSPDKRQSASPKRSVKNDLSIASSKGKLSIRDRLGLKSNPKTEIVESKEKAIIDSPHKDDKPLDPILEARKKKFESKEINVREGIIRLKPKEEPKLTKLEPEERKPQTEQTEVAPKTEPVKTETVTEEPSTTEDSKTRKVASNEALLEEDDLLQDDELDLDVQVDLFSDEDLISEDEALLTPSKEARNVKVVEKLPEKVQNGTRKTRLSPVKVLSNERSRSPTEKLRSRKSEPKRSRLVSKKLNVKTERHPKKFDRKIEIKLKSPSKSKRDSSDETVKDKKRSKKVRNVEMGDSNVKDIHEDEDDDVTEIVVESDETENVASSEGDLRAQLSKKRAEKLHKTTSSQDVASRLLQNALENALPIKKSKKSKSKDLTNSEGKLPIHLRLGIEYGSEIFAPTKPKKRSKKRKHVDDEPQ